MTQLTLFDSQGPHSLAATNGDVDQIVDNAPVIVPTETVQRIQPAPERGSSNENGNGGVKHMGDLARAVLMRYEILARRRELIRQRNLESQQNDDSCDRTTQIKAK